jgi:hypothetical protein
MNYGEGVGAALSGRFSISHPTIELPLDDILIGVENSDSSDYENEDSRNDADDTSYVFMGLNCVSSIICEHKVNAYKMNDICGGKIYENFICQSPNIQNEGSEI